MSKQTGIIRLSGSMDGLTFYKAYGKDLVRKSGGPTRHQIMTGANFQRTRENGSEFGGCSSIGAAFRKALIELKPLTDGGFGNRLNQLFRFITLNDEGLRGGRPIKLSDHRDKFKDLECNMKCKLSKVIPASFIINHNTERTRAGVTIPGGQSLAIEGPEGATHFRLVHALGVVSDYVHNKTRGYVPVEPILNTKA